MKKGLTSCVIIFAFLSSFYFLYTRAVAHSRVSSQPNDRPAVISQSEDKIILRAVLTDQNRSMAIISVNDQTSPWLVVGKEFRCWKIVSISDSNIAVTRGSRFKKLVMHR